MVRAGIIGGAGYTGGETIRLLVNHPQAELVFVHSNSNAGNKLSDVHTDLVGDTSMMFSGELRDDVDVLFLCLGHGDSVKFLDENHIAPGIKIIDLSQDFRLKANSVHGDREFIYGLTEMNSDKVRTADNIANPGCFATALQLGLLPLAANGLIKNDIHVSATTGSTGAGQKLARTSHFTWRANNLSVYKVFEHQHLNEIGESLASFGARNADYSINFIPYRGDFTRGIFASIYLKSDMTAEEAKDLYSAYYADSPFTHVSEKSIDLKQVVNTNKCLLNIEKHGENLIITSIIDNLLKGASGQAVENMNIMFGLERNAGLRLKALAF